jgi:hypothetical protein
MRSRSFVIALVGSLALAACSDSPTTNSSLTPFGQAPANLTLGQYIDQQIIALLPNGHEKSVAARWSSVQKAKGSGDMAGAVRHFNSLADWLDKKTGDFTPPAGTTQLQAAAHLVVAMATWLYEGPNAAPPAPTGADVAIGIAPAGQPFLLQTPSEHAGLSWPAGATNEDRLIVLAQDPAPYPGVCSGPLNTSRCQYPLFYTAHSYPNLRLNPANPGRFAVCMVETGERRPLEYLEDEGEGASRPIDNRMRLAHDLPANPADYTAGATQEGGIEILPKAAQQTGELVHCHEPDQHAMGRLERMLYVASKAVAKVISPKSAWAWDLGPEHQFEAFSHFNGVDPQSQPDLAVTNVAIAPVEGGDNLASVTYTVVNVSRRSGGDATGAAPTTTVTAYHSSNEVLEEGDPVIGSWSVPALSPDAAPHTATQTFVPGDYSYVIVRVFGPGLDEVTLANNAQAVPLYAREPEPPPIPAAQQLIIDTESGFAAIGSSSEQILAQVFTAPLGGTLTKVSFPVSCSGSQPLMVEIHEVPASVGYPKGDILSTTAVPAASLPPFAPGGVAFRDITLTQPVTVVQGQMLGIVLTVRAPTEDDCGVAVGPSGNPYTAGSAWFDARPNQTGVWVRSSPRDDLPFKAFIASPIL